MSHASRVEVGEVGEVGDKHDHVARSLTKVLPGDISCGILRESSHDSRARPLPENRPSSVALTKDGAAEAEVP